MKRGQKLDLKRIDYLLLVGVLFLVILGAATVYSASSYKAEQMTGDSAYFFKNQLARVFIGIVLMVIIALVDYRKWLGISPLVYTFGIFMLLLLFSGMPFVIKVNEARRWLRFGPIQFQPSDFARYAMILLLARVLYEKREKLKEFWSGFVAYLTLVGLVVLFIAMEKDLSTAVIVGLIAFLMFYFADVKLSYLLSALLSFTTLAMVYMMRTPYQLERVHKFIDQLLHRAPLAWQLQQSLIGMALGGFLGQGIGNSRQKYAFLPEAHKDFIYSVIGEEAGFIGTLLVLILFGLIIYRGLKIAQYAPDGYGRLLAGGITACIATYAMLNASVALGIVPTTGIPMPFISYGGSALVSHLAAVGLLINISSQCDPSYANYLNRDTYEEHLNRSAFKKRKSSGRVAKKYRGKYATASRS